MIIFSSMGQLPTTMANLSVYVLNPEPIIRVDVYHRSF